MSYLSDSLDFDRFWVRDLWKNVKADPKRLILGVDPASTWAWNKVLGRDDKPLVDQMGGPYDGRVFSYGHNNGEVFDRAQAAGINTAPGSQNHDIAHIVALAAMGGGALGGGGGAGGSSGAQPNLWSQGFAGKTNFATGLPSTSANVGSIPGIAGPVGGGTGASSAASLGAMDYAKLGMGLAGSAQPQQQNQTQPQQPPVRTMAQPNPNQVPTYGQRIGQGLGRVSSAMFPVDPNTGLTADQTRQLQTNALMQMGLGMLGASSQGAGFGESAAKGYGLAQGNLSGRMQQAYENAMMNRAETRATDREKRLDEQNDWLRAHTEQRDIITDAEKRADFDYRAQQDRLAREQAEADRAATSAWRKQQADLQRQQIEATAGRAQRTADNADQRAVQSLRKEYRGLDSVKNYETVLPLLESAKKAPDTGYGDMDLIYAVGKILDPGSVVREGELALTIAAGSPMQKLLGTTRFSIEKGGRLTPESRRQIVGMLEGRVGALESAYQRDLTQYSQYARELGIDPSSVVGTDAASAFSNAPVPTARKSVGGRNYVQIDGQWYEDDGS